MKISACLITKNEEGNIARCINSFKDWVDEIILVDTGSVDNTTKIAKRLGAKIYYFKWNNNFSDARNYALKQAKGQWIVFLDADEYFYERTGQNVLLFLKTIHSEKEVDAVKCRLLNLGEDGDTIVSSAYSIRIFRNHKTIKYEGNIHENLIKNGQFVTSVTVGDEFFICHTGYASQNNVDSKVKRNLELLLKELESGKDNPKVHAYLAGTYIGINDYKNVIKHAREFLNSGYQFGLRANVYRQLLWAMANDGYDIDEVSAMVSTAVSEFPDHPDLYYTFGQILFKEKKYNGALEAYEKSVNAGLKYNSDDQYAEWPSYLPEVYSVMGYINELKDNLSDAEYYNMKSLEQNKRDEQTFARLFNFIKENNLEYIVNLLKKIYNDADNDDLQFLVSNLAQLRDRKVLNYYYDILTRRFGQTGIISFFVLLANAKYQEAYKYFYNLYINGNYQTVLYAVTAALLSNDQKIIDELRSKVDPVFKNLIDCYTGKKTGICFNDGDLEIYTLILREFALLEGGKHYNSWLKLKNNFNRDISVILGEFLFNLMDFQRALDQFQDALKHDCFNKGELYFKTALCLYKKHEYKQAAEFVEDSIREGFKGNEVFELSKWIQGNFSQNFAK